MKIEKGDALDLMMKFPHRPNLIATDPPYAFGGSGAEHAISATVAIVLREAAARLADGGWLLIMCASSWRSLAYMAEAVRGLVDPVRVATWTKPTSRTKARTPGWAWSSVLVLACRKGKSLIQPSAILDHHEAAPVLNGRRAELPESVADWVVSPFASPGVFLDPFSGSGALPKAAERAGMQAFGFEQNPPEEPDLEPEIPMPLRTAPKRDTV